MQYRTFTKSGEKVSALGLGCMRLPSIPFIPFSVDEKKAVKLIHRAIELGVNYFDTARPYHLGASEKVLGKALAGGLRENVHIATKLPMFMVNKTEDFDRILNQQLKILNTGYIDTYLFHGVTLNGYRKIKDLDLLSKMEEAKAQGKIRNIGFSFHDILPVFKKLIDMYDWDVCQIQYNYLDTTLQATTEGLEYAWQKGISVVIMEPLKGGLLANPPKDIQGIFNKNGHQASAVEWALRFLWDRKEVSVVLSGMGSVKMLEENCRYADTSHPGCLSNSEKKTLNEIVGLFREKILVPCTACSYCMPCPHGVNIPENFAILNAMNSKANNMFDSVVKWFIKRKYKRLDAPGKKLDIKKQNGNAACCVNCGACEPKCPQGIKIPRELAKVNQFFRGNTRLKDLF